MSRGSFKLKNTQVLAELTDSMVLPESDYAVVENGTLYQFQYLEEDSKLRQPQPVKPGVWKIKKSNIGLYLEESTFIDDKILDSFVNTVKIEKMVDSFFNKLNVYAELGIEIPKRGALLFGPAGGGKSTVISKICRKYNTGNTLVLIWHTDVVDASDVKDFVENFDYKTHGVEKIIFIAEDIGGVEQDNVRVRSESSLLSLLDNQQKTFTIPIFILATTNYPESFMENLTNRPNRFDDKVRIDYPDGDSRVALFKFFSKAEISDETFKLLNSSKCEKFTPAHIREIIIRSRIYDKTETKVIEELIAEAKDFEKAFEKTKKQSTGFMCDD